MIRRVLTLRPPRRGVHAAAFTARRARIVSVDVDRPASVLTRFGAWAAAVTARPFPSGPHEAPIVVTLTLDREGPLEARLVSDAGFAFPAEGSLVEDAADAAPGPPATAGERPGAVPWRTLERLEDLSLEACPFPRAWPGYFLALDRRTNPCLLRRGPAGPEPLIVDPTARALVRRVLARAAGGTPEPVEAPMLAYLSRLQRDLVVGTLGPEFRGEALAAFSRFGAGELSMEVVRDDARAAGSLSNGGPNGAFVMLFAEFALAAVERGIDAEFWCSLLPATLSAAEHYVECYGRREGDRLIAMPFEEYRGVRLREVSAAGRARILARCSGCEQPEEAGRRLAELAARACVI